jgi:ribonuclease BN (tRNA processing enzyme)
LLAPHQDHCYGIFGLLMMLTMKGGKRQTDTDGGKVPFEIVGPKGIPLPPFPLPSPCSCGIAAGIKAMIEGVYTHSQSFLNFPVVYTELEEGQAHDLGVKEGTRAGRPAPFLQSCAEL